MSAVVLGLISDTHGLLRPEVHQALAGVSRILHAGDVGGDEILAELELIAPVMAVAGNCDDPDDPKLSRELTLTVEGVRIHVSHGHELGVPTVPKLLAAHDADVIVYGHTHRPYAQRAADGRLVINPGAAGPRRFDLSPSVARLTIDHGRATATLVSMGEDTPRRAVGD